MTKGQITFDQFLEIENKLEIRIGQILAAERIPKSKKLLKMLVIFGPNKEDEKTVVTNLGDKFEPETFIGLFAPFIMNLTPSVMMGVESQAMIMVGEKADGTLQLERYSMGTKLL
jgi:methionyl-tRNA synthetase